MQRCTTDYLKKALLDTQERVRDYTNYADAVDDRDLQKCFREFAEVEGLHAKVLQDFITQFQ